MWLPQFQNALNFSNMKNIYFCFVIFSVLCLQSCETYGPASRYQATRYMDYPFYEDKDTSNTYIQGGLSNGTIYKINDQNYSGQFSYHHSNTFRRELNSRFFGRDFHKVFYKYTAFGGFGTLGNYIVNDSISLMYQSVGLRLQAGNLCYTKNNDTEFNFSGILGIDTEMGSYHNFRTDFEQKSKKSSEKPNRLSFEMGMMGGFRTKFKNDRMLKANFGLGLVFNSFFGLNAYYNIGYNFNRKLFLMIQNNITSIPTDNNMNAKNVPFFSIIVGYVLR
jgi:hypothetical protein